MTESEVPAEEDVTKRVTERLTVVLESTLRNKTNLERERLKRFLPLAEELADEEPALLAMMLDDLYHAQLHQSQDEQGVPKAKRGDSQRRHDSPSRNKKKRPPRRER